MGGKKVMFDVTCELLHDALKLPDEIKIVGLRNRQLFEYAGAGPAGRWASRGCS